MKNKYLVFFFIAISNYFCSTKSSFKNSGIYNFYIPKYETIYKSIKNQNNNISLLGVIGVVTALDYLNSLQKKSKNLELAEIFRTSKFKENNNSLTFVQPSIDQSIEQTTNESLLIWAYKNEYAEIVEFLLSLEDLYINNKVYKTIFWDALKVQNIRILKLLIVNKNIELEYKSKERKLAFFLAAKFDNLELITSLLEKYKVDINVKDKYDNTALIIAAIFGSINVLDFLLKQEKINVNDTDKELRTALWWACRYNNTKIIELLLQHKNIKINKKDNKGNTALVVAFRNAKNKEIKNIELLFKQAERV